MEAKLKRDLVDENGGDDPTVTDNSDDSPQQRRNIRSKFRDIESRIKEGKDEIASGDLHKFMKIMKEVENMHEQVAKPREQVADAEALLGLTNTLMASVKTHTTGGVTPAEFVSCLIREFGLTKAMNEPWQNISWKNIGIVVSPIFMNGPGCKTMIGPMQNELKQRKVTVRAKRSRPVGSSRPEEIEKTADVVTDTEKNMRTMFEILKKEKRVRVENLLLNSNSFAQTVENLFTLSFLVKDGRVCITVDESGSQLVVPRNAPSAQDIMSGVVKNHPFIFRFDFDDWKHMKNMVREGEELMPHRDVFINESPTRAKAKPCDNGFGQTKAVPSECQLAPAVKKFSRNYGRATEKSDLIEVGVGTDLNWKCKRKRSR